jgi:hypothetical protein
MKQLGLALHNYHDTMLTFPYSATLYSGTSPNHHTWVEFTLPYIDQAPLYNQIDFSIGNLTGANLTLLNNKSYTFQQCPSNPFSSQRAPTTNATFTSDWSGSGVTPSGYNVTPMCYAPCAGPAITVWGTPPDCPTNPSYCALSGTMNLTVTPGQVPGMFSMGGEVAIKVRDVTDGTSNTILLGERRGELCQWMGPFATSVHGFVTGLKVNSPQIGTGACYTNSAGASSYHTGGAHFVMTDGAVRFISNNVDFATYNYIGGKSEGQTVGDF